MKRRGTRDEGRKFFSVLCILLSVLLIGCASTSAQEQQIEDLEMDMDTPAPEKASQEAAYDLSDTTSENLTLSAWEALGTKDYAGVFVFTDACIKLYQDQALKEQASLKTFAPIGKEFEYATLNDIAACYFIRGKALWQQGRLEDAKKEFQVILDKFSYAQSWDPKGWFWKVAEIAGGDIKKIDQQLQEAQPK